MLATRAKRHSGMTLKIRGKFMKNKAFTLIELLIVILIIGVLASIVFAQYRKIVIKSKLAQVDVGISTAIKNVNLYLHTNGYPATNGSFRRFAGTQSIADIKMPGDCDSHGYLCKTNVGSFGAECRRTQKDGKAYCYAVYDEGRVGFYMVINEGEEIWHLESIGLESSGKYAYLIKFICQWAQERGYPGAATVVAQCAHSGITLKNKDN